MNFSEFQTYIPFLIPLVVIQLALMVSALVDLAGRQETRGPKWVWILVVILVNIVGPIVYFVAGRKEK